MLKKYSKPGKKSAKLSGHKTEGNELWRRRGKNCQIDAVYFKKVVEENSPKNSSKCSRSNQIWVNSGETTRIHWYPWISINEWRAEDVESRNWPAGAILTNNPKHYPGPKMWNQDPRLAGGGNLYKTESQCPGPKTWNQDPRLAGGGKLPICGHGQLSTPDFSFNSRLTNASLTYRE